MPTGTTHYVNLFGNGVFADIIQMRLHWLMVGSNSNDWCPDRKREPRDTQMHREWHMIIKAEIRERQLQVKAWIVRSHQNLGRGKKGFFPGGFRGSMALPTLISDF